MNRAFFLPVSPASNCGTLAPRDFRWFLFRGGCGRSRAVPRRRPTSPPGRRRLRRLRPGCGPFRAGGEGPAACKARAPVPCPVRGSCVDALTFACPGRSGGNTGSFDEIWTVGEYQCQQLCAASPACVAIGYVFAGSARETAPWRQTDEQTTERQHCRDSRHADSVSCPCPCLLPPQAACRSASSTTSAFTAYPLRRMAATASLHAPSLVGIGARPHDLHSRL